MHHFIPTYWKKKIIPFKYRLISRATIHAAKQKINSYPNRKIVPVSLDGYEEPAKCLYPTPRRSEGGKFPMV